MFSFVAHPELMLEYVRAKPTSGFAAMETVNRTGAALYPKPLEVWYRELMAKQFSYEFLVLEADLDSFGHVNNAIYLRYFEAARWDMVQSQGYGLQDMQTTGIGPVILEVNVKFKKELRLREKVRIESQVVSHTRAVAVMEQKLFNGAGELCAQAAFSFALFDLNKRRVVPPTEKWIKALGLTPEDLKRE